MCRNQAKELSAAFARVPPGHFPKVRLVAVVRENHDGEIDGFAKFWPHDIVFDLDSMLYKALFDGILRTTSGLKLAADVVQPCSPIIQNWVKAKGGDVGDDYNFKGDGFTHGGLFVMAARGHKLLYAYTQDRIGDAPDPERVIESINISTM